MKFLTVLVTIIILYFSAFSQNSDKVLATATGIKFTAKDLSSEFRSEYLNSDKLISEKRASLLNDQITSELLNLEATANSLSVDKFIETVVFANINNPTDAEVKSVFELNRAQIGNKTFDEISPEIIKFLRREPEQKAIEEYAAKLKVKHKVVLGKNILGKNSKDSDVLVSFGTKQITFKNFLDKNGSKLADFEGELYEYLKFEAEKTVFGKILVIEAEAQELKTSELIAREITDKLREFSDEERELLESSFQRKLFSKYNVKTFLDEPVPFVQKISTDDDPAQGNPNATVTVVMFSDFQCPACASVHPIVRRVIAGFGNKVRLVVRDFPLLKIHANAFRAAIAANAANVQGKYFEYADMLYKNQENLDENSLKKYAANLGLNLERFELDLVNEKNANEVLHDLTDGSLYGISGTPTIYVNGVKVRILSAEALTLAIEKALIK